MTKLLAAVNSLVHFTNECANGHDFDKEKNEAINDVLAIGGAATFIPVSQAQPEQEDHYYAVVAFSKNNVRHIEFCYWDGEAWISENELFTQGTVIAWRNVETSEELAAIA